MPRLDYKTCRRCRRHTDECGPLSRTRLCGKCGVELVECNYDALTAHDGPEFLRWRRRIAASVGGVLLDDLTERP
jgi:hypothetical protein